MSTLLWAIAGYIAIDRLLTIAWVGRTVDITRAHAVVSVVTGAFIVTVLVLAALNGVTP